MKSKCTAASIGPVIALLLLLLGPVAADAQMYEGRQLVKATLVADTSAVAAGKPFTVGLLLQMAPGWHTYWKFPGDAGLPTEIKWTLPAGWTAGDIQWPIPLKTDDPGDIQTYGYQDEVLLTQEITPGANVTGSQIQLVADANWLVCEKICIPGSANLKLDLPVGGSAEPRNADLFARFRSLLPKQFPNAKTATTSWSHDAKALQLSVKSAQLATYPAVDFFPLPLGETVVSHPSVESRKGDTTTFRIPIVSPGNNLTSIPGLIVYAKTSNGADRAAWQLGTSPVPTTTAAVPTTMRQDSRGLLTFLLFGFLGGFILNLMPCVLPVISLKIFGFIQQAGQSRQKIFRSGLAFTAGIFAWFITLALVLIALKSGGRDVTWGGFQFTNAYFVLGLSVIVLIFALNLFGVFEISLPQGLTRGLLASSDRKDNLGSFFQGVFATVLATPCTAPFLGTALGFAFTQSSLVILSMFVAVAAGMSAPYLLLSAQPAWLRFLPRPGPWMVHVKQFMGFLLLATLLFLLYVLGAQRGLDGAIWASCFLLVVAIVCWIKGVFVVPTASATKRVVSVVVMAALVILGGIYFISGKFKQARLDVAQVQQGDWQPFTPERLQTERDQGRPVFVDFTAAWCLTCKFNEKSVLENAAVREAFQRHGVVKLKADWTNGDPVITKLLQHFGRPGVPLYVLYPSKSDEPIVFPELLTKGYLLDKLETITTTVASQ